MFKKCCIAIKRTIFIAIFFCVVASVSLLGLISYKPITINTDRDFVRNILNIQGNQLELGKLSMWFDGSLHLRGSDGEINTKTNGQTLKIGKLEVEFSNTAILFGSFAPKHIMLEELSLDVNIERDAFLIAGFPLQVEAKENTETVDLIDYLNQKQKVSPYYEILKSISAKNINLNINDEVNAKSWFIRGGRVNFSRSFRDGESLKITGKVERDNVVDVTPISMVFNHRKYAESATLKINLKNASSKFFDDYIPFKNPIQTKGNITITSDILANSVIENTNIIMEMEEGTIHASTAYNFPFAFKSGFLDITYSDKNDGLLFINKIELLDQENWPVEVKGTIKNILKPNDLYFNLHLKSLGDTTIRRIASYLPDKRISGTTNWLRNNINGSLVSNLQVSYIGKPSELPICGKKCGFDGSFDFEDLSLTFLENTGPAENLIGHFEMKDDYIKVTAKTGEVEGQQIENLTAIISGHFTKDATTGITLDGNVLGSIQGLLDIIEQEVSKEKWGIKITGTHKSKAHVYLPLKDLTFNKVKYNFDSDLKGMATTTIVKNADIKISNGKLKASDAKLKLTANGTLNGYNVSYDWRENMKHPMQETSVVVSAELPASKVMDMLNDISIDISETVSVTLNAKAKKGGYNFTLNSDMSKNEMSQNLLNWNKPKGEAFNVVAKGEFNGKQDNLPLNLLIKGKDVDVQGNIVLGYKFKGDFKVFNVDKNKLKVAINGDILNLVGEQLDLSHLDLFKLEISGSSPFSNINITANVDNLLLKNGEIKKVDVNLEYSNAQWKNIELKAISAEKPLVFSLKYPSDDHMILKLDTYAAGEVFKSVGLYDDLRKGHAKINASIYTVDGKKEGSGIIKIDDVYLVKAPVLAKLLSLISLTEILSQKKGIYFNETSIPLIFNDDELIIDHASLSGPSIGLRLKGKINTSTDALNIEGQLIPAEGINSFISKIPLIGTLLTGSQSGLLVADFTVKGTASDTNVSANPISFVMPGLLKDFFGTLFNYGDITKPTNSKEKAKKYKKEDDKPTWNDWENR